MVLDQGVLYTCGAGDAGQLGTGGRGTELLPKAVAVEGKVVSVACGIFHTIVVNDKGTVWAMGGNSFGQLGTGNKKGATVPTRVAALDTVKVRIVTCGHHTAAATEDGELYFWGSGAFGELLLPQRVQLDAKIRSISVGGSVGTALDRDGRVWVWGANSAGELGLGDYEPRASPCLLEKLRSKPAVSIACGGAFAVALGVTHVNSSSVAPLADPAQQDKDLEKSADTQEPCQTSSSRNSALASNEINAAPKSPAELAATSAVENPAGSSNRLDTQGEIPSVSDMNTAEIFSSVSQRDPHQPVIFVRDWGSCSRF